MANRAAVLLLALALSGCAEEAAPGGGGEPLARPDPVILELQSAEDEPIGLLSYGGADQSGELGTHCWATQCVDFIGPPTPKTFTEIPGDAVIELTGDSTTQTLSVGAPPKEKFGPLRNERQVEVEDGRAHLDLKPGQYVLVVFATWAEGDAVLTFGLEVPDSETTTEASSERAPAGTLGEIYEQAIRSAVGPSFPPELFVVQFYCAGAGQSNWTERCDDPIPADLQASIAQRLEGDTNVTFVESQEGYIGSDDFVIDGGLLVLLGTAEVEGDDARVGINYSNEDPGIASNGEFLKLQRRRGDEWIVAGGSGVGASA